MIEDIKETTDDVMESVLTENPAEQLRTQEQNAPDIAAAAQEAADNAEPADMESDEEESYDKIDEIADDNADYQWNPDIDEEFVEQDSPQPSIESVIEAVLFTTDEPMTAQRIVKIVDLSSLRQVTDAINALNSRYEQTNSAFRIEKIAGGYQMLTHKIYNNWLRRLIRVRTETKLTQASLETLAIIAYKQPIIRADIEAIRGVASGEMIRGLMSKGLVKIAGRAEVLGRPMQYGTTRKFLETFGLNSIKDLPKAEELKKPRD